jgi:hypothetical protein
MILTTILTAAIGYALIYAAVPSRDALRSRTRVGIRRLLVVGGAIGLVSAVAGAMAVGPVTGPFVACAAALTAGSVLILIGPFFSRS